MDGKTLTRELQKLLSETATGTWLDLKSSYDYLYKAAIETTAKTMIFKSTQTITTVAHQAEYDLNTDFMGLHMKDDNGQFFVKYSDGTNTYWIFFKDYDSIILAQNTTPVIIPYNFTITDHSALAQVTGVTSADGAASGGECTLTKATGTFIADGITAGDLVHNTTDGSNGVVLAVTSTTALVTALFDGTNDDWTSADAFKINPQGRYQLIFDPPPDVAGHTATVYYIQRPAPVYSLYRYYRFPIDFSQALVFYAAWLYKYRDREVNFGDSYFKYWDRTVREYNSVMNKAKGGRTFGVNLMSSAKKRAS